MKPTKNEWYWLGAIIIGVVGFYALFVDPEMPGQIGRWIGGTLAGR